MQCKLVAIDSYPFPVEQENNIFRLSYLAFAGRASCDLLKIEYQGYRIIEHEIDPVTILICFNEALHEEDLVEQPVLSVPFNLFRLSTPNSRVMISRPALELDPEGMPAYQIAEKVYLKVNGKEPFQKLLLKVATCCSYVLNEGISYLDTEWLARFLMAEPDLRVRCKVRMKMFQNQKGKYHNYFPIHIEVATNSTNCTNLNEQKYLFVPEKTTIQILKQSLQPLSEYKTISLSPIYRRIFLEAEYQKLKPQLLSQLHSNGIILLHSQSQLGLSAFIHSICQQEHKCTHFKRINCKNYGSVKEIYKEISEVHQLPSTVILLKDVAWMVELGKDRAKNWTIRELIAKLENCFMESVLKNYRKYTLIIMAKNQEQIHKDMLLKGRCFSLTLGKDRKIDFIRLILNEFEGTFTKDQQEIIINMLWSAVGWTKLYKFLKSLTCRHQEIDTKSLLKAIETEIKVQKVQNIADVSWEDIGGLQAAKQDIIQTVLLPSQHPQIFDEWIKPRTGLLFYGPPGTGKTLLGKCIAKECKMGFISVKGPELLNMYVGESEKNVRAVFERAVASRPCIVFMDELDALIPKRGNSSDSNQVMDRIVAELLTQMDKASSNGIFVIGATNRPDLLDPSIMRPGRFDKQIYLGISEGKEEKIKILKAQTRRLTLSKYFDFGAVVDSLPPNMTGADFYGVTSKAILTAVERIIKDSQGQELEEVPEIVVTIQDFLDVCPTVKPSVTEADLQHYETLKSTYS